ncbi:MAG: hypothetical protein ACK5TK_04525 [Betaproteobacteria bacterium]
MPKRRDSQRSRVYDWERTAVRQCLRRSIYAPDPEFADLEAIEVWLAPIWRAERGRLGRARVPAPALARKLWGQRRATAGWDHVLKLPRWARSPWVVLHELAHRLTPHDEAHGPRFVGVLIGLACRHIEGLHAETLMALADDMRVRYYLRSIGKVPVITLPQRVEQVLRDQGPLPEMFIASELDLSYRQVRGAALTLIRTRRARWYRKRLVLCGDAVARPT